MKASILIVTILGMIAIKSVTGGPIEDPQQNGSNPGDVSAVDVPIEDPQQETSISDDVSAVDDPIEDPQQQGLISEDISDADGLNEDPQQDGSISDEISAVDALSRRKRASKIFLKFIDNMDFWKNGFFGIKTIALIEYEFKQAAVGKFVLVTLSLMLYRACIA